MQSAVIRELQHHADIPNGIPPELDIDIRTARESIRRRIGGYTDGDARRIIQSALASDDIEWPTTAANENSRIPLVDMTTAVDSSINWNADNSPTQNDWEYIWSYSIKLEWILYSCKFTVTKNIDWTFRARYTSEGNLILEQSWKTWQQAYDALVAELWKICNGTAAGFPEAYYSAVLESIKTEETAPQLTKI